MLAVKNKLNSMKIQSELSEERIRNFESQLIISKTHLENALIEKEALQRKIEAVEMQIINANKLREDMMERCKILEVQIDENIDKRKDLQNQELIGDDALQKLETRLKSARDNYKENSIRCDEAEKRLHSLNSDSQTIMTTRMRLEGEASRLEKEIDQKLLKVNSYEDFERKASEDELKQAGHLKLLESYYRDAEERKEIGHLNVSRLQRIVEKTEDEIETLQLRSRTAKVELQNVVQTVTND